MNCAVARHLIHLDVGDDLRTDEEQQLSGHMEHCEECREYHAGMASAMIALLSLRGTSSAGSLPDPAGHSVWPTVSREITRRRTTPAANRKFNLRVAALSVCSLALAVVTIVQSLSAMRASSERTVMQGQSASLIPNDAPQFPGNQPFSRVDVQSEFAPFLPRTLPEFGPQSF